MIGTFGVVSKHPQRGCFEVVELPLPGRPHECPNADEHDTQGYGDQNKQNRHDPALNVSLRQAITMTVTELTGIMMAAISGLMIPVTARAAPMTL